MKTHFCRLKFKKSIFFAVFLSFFSLLFAVDYFEEGKKLLFEDKPQEAVSALFKAIQEPGTPKSVYLYLGVAYLRIGKYNDSLTYLSQGKDKDILNGHLYHYNIGNVYFLQNQFDASESAYSEAISSNGLYAPAFLNRANARIKLERLEGALQDYKIYLNLNPGTLQRSSIEKMISLLENIAEEAARARALAEAKKAAEEAERLAAEERYKKLMDDVNSNLSSVDNADAISAGADDTIDYSEENELD
ncbi:MULTISPECIES: M48 family metallopeptidase [unclassified Treponema]|uniref:tetratricopeptide repeat protein n=1 Tax=unclassified Treponema TaxID=2638727 RepID=UPI0020A416EB|nr:MULTISPECIES: hypothetical protein [unclassified Treponema]UTC65910.1 hypothetical protein E4O06_07685 [Treponema sp. OMZ 789]UTC68638.1 hypothetical protein E4O01_07825 [Treponema sp. OMZ 790]UTC71368.1 hypothetical protein E4O02_08020 [Treponema sp. OMZ 791]